MQYIRKAEQRGQANFGWLNSHHSFSFGHYYDPEHMGVSALRVINDDIVKPSRGFDTHGHQDMEIISYVIDGALKHKDSEGNEYTVPAGDIQVMSAGSGIRHSEFNASDSSDVHFLQIWIVPNTKGQAPSYAQQKVPSKEGMTTLVTPDGSNGTLPIKQDATMSRLVLQSGQSFALETARVAYLHLVKGEVSVNGESFKSGDGFALNNEEKIELQASSDIEALWFDLPL